MRQSFLTLAAFSISFSLSAQAQDSNRELDSAAARTAACLEIEDAGERLACFEQAAEGLNSALNRENKSPEAPSSPVKATAERDDPAEPAAADTQAADATALPPPAPETSTPSAAAESDVPTWAQPTQRAERGTEAEAISVSVTRIIRNNSGRHFFITSDGQEWEQTFAATVRPPKSLPADATIEQAILGSPRLTFDDGPSGAYKVRRIK